MRNHDLTPDAITYAVSLGKTLRACLHGQNKSVFLEGRLFSSQSEPLKSFLNCSDWLDKSRFSKKGTFELDM